MMLILVIVLSLLFILLFTRNIILKRKFRKVVCEKLNEIKKLEKVNVQSEGKIIDLERKLKSYEVKSSIIKNEEFDLINYLKGNEPPSTFKGEWEYTMKKITDLKKEKNEKSEKVGEKFEKALEGLFEGCGYKVKNISEKQGSEGGKDLVIKLKGIEFWVEAKVRHHETTGRIGVKDIRNLHSAIVDYDNNSKNKKPVKGIVITTAFPTIQARRFASRNGIEIIDRKKLFTLIGFLCPDALDYTWIQDREDNFKKCLNCDGVEIKKHNKKSGKNFYTCVNYDKENEKKCEEQEETKLFIKWN